MSALEKQYHFLTIIDTHSAKGEVVLLVAHCQETLGAEAKARNILFTFLLFLSGGQCKCRSHCCSGKPRHILLPYHINVTLMLFVNYLCTCYTCLVNCNKRSRGMSFSACPVFNCRCQHQLKLL